MRIPKDRRAQRPWQGRLRRRSIISSRDTVPFVIWSAARHLHDFETALWETVVGLGDRDTTAAMVGGGLVNQDGAFSSCGRSLE